MPIRNGTAFRHLVRPKARTRRPLAISEIVNGGHVSMPVRSKPVTYRSSASAAMANSIIQSGGSLL